MAAILSPFLRVSRPWSFHHLRHTPLLKLTAIRHNIAERGLRFFSSHDAIKTGVAAADAVEGADVVSATEQDAVVIKESEPTQREPYLAPNQGQPWSQEDEALLLSGWKEGALVENIGRELGRHGEAVYKRVARLRAQGFDVPLRSVHKPWTAEDRNIMHSMKETGLPDRDIAAQLGRPLMSVRRARSYGSKKIPTCRGTAGSKRPYRKWEQEEVETILRMRSEGSCWKDIEKRLERHDSECRRLYRQEVAKRGLPPTEAKVYWTPEEDAILREFKLRKGVTYRTIAARLPGRSVGSVKIRAQALGLTLRQRTCSKGVAS